MYFTDKFTVVLTIVVCREFIFHNYTTSMAIFKLKLITPWRWNVLPRNVYTSRFINQFDKIFVLYFCCPEKNVCHYLLKYERISEDKKCENISERNLYKTRWTTLTTTHLWWINAAVWLAVYTVCMYIQRDMHISNNSLVRGIWAYCTHIVDAFLPRVKKQ